jgi:heterodisulfide reductase subunit B
MKYLFFPGCKIPYYLKEYGASSRAVLELLGVELIDIYLNCCGYPIRHQSYAASILCAARNITIAQKNSLDIVTPCQCCFGNLKFAENELMNDISLREYINSELKKEGLFWDQGVNVKHILSVLFHDIGIETISARIKNPVSDLKVAAHYGCHALRPSNVVQFDNPFNPTIFEELVRLTGAETVEWERRLECCGNPLWGKNNSLSIQIMRKKLEDAFYSGADCICTACTYCQIQFDSVRHEVLKKDPLENPLGKKVPAVLYTHLLGKSLGIDDTALGIQESKNSIRQLISS